jgi:hypothetical protein
MFILAYLQSYEQRIPVPCGQSRAVCYILMQSAIPGKYRLKIKARVETKVWQANRKREKNETTRKQTIANAVKSGSHTANSLCLEKQWQLHHSRLSILSFFRS